MIKVLTKESEMKSASRLGFPTFFKSIKKPSNKYVYLRWGNSFSNYDDNLEKVINPADAIYLNCKKNISFQRLSQVVNTPTFFKEFVPKGVKAVIRENTHASGEGFKVVDGPYTIPQGYYGKLYIPAKEEYRVWFCGDAVKIAKRKPLLSQINNDKYQCRSMWSYDFNYKPNDQVKKETLDAAKTIGLETGAADILKHDNKYYFLELNSAPTLDMVTNYEYEIIDFYQYNISRLVLKKFNIVI